MAVENEVSKIVSNFPEASMAPERAAGFMSPDVKINFTGGRAMKIAAGGLLGCQRALIEGCSIQIFERWLQRCLKTSNLCNILAGNK